MHSSRMQPLASMAILGGGCLPRGVSQRRVSVYVHPPPVKPRIAQTGVTNHYTSRKLRFRAVAINCEHIYLQLRVKIITLQTN